MVGRNIKVPYCNVYINDTNGRVGLVDEDNNIILQSSYKDIRPYYYGKYPGYGNRYIYLLKENVSEIWENQYKNSVFFIVTTDVGKFLYNLNTNRKSLVYDDVFIGGYEHAHIIFKSKSKYGILNIEGEVLLNPYLEFSKSGYQEFLYYEFNKKIFTIWIENGLLYDKIPVKKYDICFRVGYNSFNSNGHFYIYRKNHKFGILSAKCNVISEPIIDNIVLHKSIKHYLITPMRDGITFVIAIIDNKYRLYNTQDGSIIIDDCDLIKYTPFIAYDDERGTDFIEFKKGTIRGYVLWNGKVLSTDYYDDVELKKPFIYLKKNNLMGVFKPSGEELLPCIYRTIIHKYNGVFTVTKDDKEETINVYSNKQSNYRGINNYHTYGRYAGSYAQDVAGYSDDDIDTIFDGDPSAYWNID